MRQQRFAYRGQGVSRSIVLDEACLAQFLEPGVEHAGVGFAEFHQVAKREMTMRAQFPNHPQRFASVEQLKEV